MNPKQVNHASNAIGTAAIRTLLRMRKREAAAQQETIALVMNGQLQQALARENSPSVDRERMMVEMDQADN